MLYYFAPMEGITGYIYRNAHHAFFDQIDKYYSPFIVPNQKGKLRSKETNDILPENNKGLVLIPQILTNNATDFISTSKALKEIGYKEINLNLGCPSGTVVSKNRGSGFLAKREALDVFLEEIFTASNTPISVKTRIGKDDPNEFYELIEIFNKYPITELIIHPRIRQDFYNNKPNMKVFQDALSLSKNPVCYNGDIVSPEDIREFEANYPNVGSIMIGRGLLRNPGLITGYKNNTKTDKKILKELHDRIYEDYQKIISGDRNLLFKMKELWFYMAQLFSDNEKYAKKIRKAERLKDYNEAVNRLFDDQELII